ncbi:G-protein alpha subunit-domain-containing protein [Mycena rebaudengoi]|nr:G-protein alpha subunit-domain-containing protein [Mycena rebaudengoi]
MPPLTRQQTPQSLLSVWSDSKSPGATISLHVAAKPLIKFMYHRQAHSFIERNHGISLSRESLDIFWSYLTYKYISRKTKLLVLKEFGVRATSEVDRRTLMNFFVENQHLILELLESVDTQVHRWPSTILENLAPSLIKQCRGIPLSKISLEILSRYLTYIPQLLALKEFSIRATSDENQHLVRELLRSVDTEVHRRISTLLENWGVQELKKEALKIIFLGQSESGKSSAILDFRRALTPKYFESRRLILKTVIHLSLIGSIQKILTVLQHEWDVLEGGDPAETTTPLTSEHRQLVLLLSPLLAGDAADPSQVTQVLAACKNEIIALWEDDVVQRVLASRDVHLQEERWFFLDDTARIAALDYEPSDRDIIRMRIEMRGIEEHLLVVESGLSAGMKLSITEVCGSSNLRSAWIPYFDDVQAILFFAPLVFWQNADKDSRVNRVQESLELWREIVSAPLLAKTALILLFSKKDIVQAQIAAGVLVKNYIPSFGDRPNDVDTVTEYLRDKFSAYHRKFSPLPRPFILFQAEAINAWLATVIVGAVQDAIVGQHLRLSRID